MNRLDISTIIKYISIIMNTDVKITEKGVAARRVAQLTLRLCCAGVLVA
jgi:hypothetical protein